MTDDEMFKRLAAIRLDLATLLVEASTMALTEQDGAVGRYLTGRGVTVTFVMPLARGLAEIDSV